MLEIKRERLLGRMYQVVLDGSPVAKWTARAWKSGGRVELPGETLDLRAEHWGRSFEMRAGDEVRASAHREGRQWHIAAGGEEYELSRPSAFRGTRSLMRGDHSLGEFRRSGFGGGLAAELPGVPAPLQVFAGLVVLALWQRRDTATVAAASAASSG